MRNNFSKCREWVPRGTSQHKWRWLTTLLLILTLGIGNMWAVDPTAMYSIGFENGTDGWGKSSMSDGPVEETTNVRTGAKAAKYKSSSSKGYTTKQISFTKNTKIHGIYWVKASEDKGVYLSLNSDNGSVVTVGNSSWTKVTHTYSYTSKTGNKNVRLYMNDTKANVYLYIDDVVFYYDDRDTIDFTKPTSVSGLSATTSEISWTNGSDGAKGTGIQNTLIWKRTGGSANDLTLNNQGNYVVPAEGSTLDQSGHWTLVTASVAADAETYDGTFVAGDVYAIVHRDLAYNYSSPAYVTIPASCTTPTTAFANESYTIDGTPLTLSSLISNSQGDGAISYEVTDANGTGASISEGVFTATNAGTATVTATQAADATNGYCQKVMEATITVLAAGAVEYNINYAETKGAANSNPAKYTKGTGIAEFAALADVTDFHFTGWDPASISSEATGDQTITAQWVAAYDVTFDKGSATGTAPDAFQKWQGAKFNLPGQGSMVAPANTVFDGWKADGAGETLAANTEYTMNAAAVEFVAQWKPVIKLVLQDGANYSINTTNFSAVDADLMTEDVTVGTTNYSKTVKLAGKAAGMSKVDAFNKVISYETTTDATHVKISFYDVYSSNTTHKAYVMIVKEGETTPTTNDEISIAIATQRYQVREYDLTGHSTMYICVGDQNIRVCQIEVNENGAVLANSEAPAVGYSINLNKGRLLVPVKQTDRAYEGLTYNLADKYYPGTSTEAKIGTNNSDYISFVIPTGQTRQLQLTTSNAAKYTVSKTKGDAANQFTPTANTAKNWNLTEGTWYINPQGSNVQITNIAFAAAPATVTVSFDSDGGTDVASQVAFIGDKAVAPTAPTKTNCDFVKWIVKSTEEDYDWNAVVAGSLELKAVWAAWPTLTLAAGEGATGDPVATQYKAGTEITVPEKPATFSKGTDVFTGWAYSQAVEVNEGKFEMPSTSLTLTAQWQAPSNFAVKFYQGYGEPNAQIGETQNISTGNYATAPDPDPTREGYEFLGWSTDGTEANIVDVASHAVLANTDFTAVWKQVWTVTFDGAGAVVVDNGAKVSSPNSPSQAGKVFLGWYYGENKYDFSANVTANLALTSKWADVDPNHFVYAYNDDFHYDGVLYKTPEGKVDAGAGSPNIALTNTAYSLFSGAAGITSVVVNNGIYDSKSGAEQGVTALVKLNTTSTSNLTVTIKAGYTAVMKVKMGSWNVATAAPTVTFKKGEDAISYTGTMDGKASDQSYAELTYNLEAGTYVMTTATKTLYFSSIDIQATALPTYAVTYDANGGEGTMTDANEYYEGAEVTLLENTFAPASGFMWSGWAVTGNVSGDPIAVSEGKFTMPDEAVTVTAQWTDVSKVVKIVETDAKYDNFADAYTAATAGQTIQLLQNIELSGAMFSITKNLTVDLNGKVWSHSNPSAKMIEVVEGATLTITGTAANSEFIGRINLGKAGNSNGSLIIDGGYYHCGNAQTVLHINGECMNSNVTIENATFVSPTDNAIQLNGKGTFNLTNSSFTGATGIYIKAGTLNIENCTVVGNMTPANYSYYGNGANATGDGIVVDACNYPGGAPTINIISGNFEGTKSAVGSYNYQGTSEPAVGGIEGGTFSSAVPAALCAEGLVPSPADPVTGKYTVQPKEALCLIKAELSAPDNNTVATPTITVGYGNAEVGGNVKGAKTHETIVGYKFNADGAYLYVTLANGSFQAGDSVEVYMTYGAKALAVYPHFNSAALATSAASASAALGKNYVVLAENADTLYIARKDNNGWNPNVAYIAVYRVADPMLQKFEMAGAAGVINEAAKTVTVELPYNTDVTALTPTKINYVSNGDPVAPATAVSPTGAQNFTNPVVYTITDKDGSTTAYTVTVNIAAPSNDATLSALSYGDPATAIALEDGVYEYVVNLAKGTTVVPELTATANEPTLVQSVVVQNAATFENYEATSTVLVTAQDNTTKLTYTVHFNVAHAVAALVDVTENTTWDWSLVTSRADGSDIDEIISGKNHGPRVATADGLILANYVLGGNNWDKIEGNNTAYAIRNAANKYYQGASLHMHTTVSGYLKIHARNDGSAMKLKVQNAGRDMEVSALGNWKDYTVYVVAGDVTIYNVPEEDNKPMRIDYMEFTVDETPDHTRDIATLNIGNIGTLCVDHNVPVGGMVGATFYQIAGKDEYGKIAFDEVDSLVAGEPYIFQSHTNLLTLYYGNVTADEAVVKNGMHGYLGDANYTLDIDESNKTDIMYIANNRLWNCEDLVGIGLTVVPNRCYIVYSAVSDLDNNSTPNNVRKRVFIGGASAPQTATGLENLVGGEQAQKLMINGQLYILRGEKLFDATGRLVK